MRLTLCVSSLHSSGAAIVWACSNATLSSLFVVKAMTKRGRAAELSRSFVKPFTCTQKSKHHREFFTRLLAVLLVRKHSYRIMKPFIVGGFPKPSETSVV